jgi:hypothetical protein
MPLGLLWVYRDGVLVKKDRSDQSPTGPDPDQPAPPTDRDNLIYGAYCPGPTTTGVLSGTVLTDYNASMVNNVTLLDGGLIENKRIYGDIKMNSATDVTIRNCELVGGAHDPSGASGIVDCNSARTGKVILIDCTIIPRRRSMNRDCIVGEKWQAYRCKLQAGVDGMGIFIVPSRYSPANNNANVIAMGNWVSDLSYFYPDSVHTDGTHNDGAQIQGGRNVHLKGNFFELSTTQVTGNNPAKPWLMATNNAAGSGVIVQDNTGAGIDNTVVIEENYFARGLAHVNIKPEMDFIFRNNKHYRVTAVAPAGSGYTWRGYWIRFDKKTGAVVSGITAGIPSNTWADGPYVGDILSDPRDLGIDYINP